VSTAVGDWVRLKSIRSEFSAEQPEHQARLHRVIELDEFGHVLTACHRQVWQGVDEFQIPDGSDDRPRCRLCEKSRL
jgi:hypothetical protein